MTSPNNAAKRKWVSEQWAVRIEALLRELKYHNLADELRATPLTPMPDAETEKLREAMVEAVIPYVEYFGVHHSEKGKVLSDAINNYKIHLATIGAKPNREAGAYVIAYPDGSAIVRHWNGHGWAFVPKEPYAFTDDEYVSGGGKISPTPISLDKPGERG